MLTYHQWGPVTFIRGQFNKSHWPSITKISSKITYLKFHHNLPGANELSQYYCGILCSMTLSHYPSWTVRIILCMYPANGRWRYTVTSSLIGWAHTQNDPWTDIQNIIQNISLLAYYNTRHHFFIEIWSVGHLCHEYINIHCQYRPHTQGYFPSRIYLRMDPVI